MDPTDTDDLRAQRDAALDALIDLANIASGEPPDPWTPGEPKPETVAGNAYTAVCALVEERDELRAKVHELSQPATVAALNRDTAEAEVANLRRDLARAYAAIGVLLGVSYAR